MPVGRQADGVIGVVDMGLVAAGYIRRVGELGAQAPAGVAGIVVADGASAGRGVVLEQVQTPAFRLVVGVLQAQAEIQVLGGIPFQLATYTELVAVAQ
ncbi:hypothetical protein D9M70_469120 [compost metagenome]